VLGIYIHFPWCRNLCPYCDFPVAVAREGTEPPHEAYRDAILGELRDRAGAYEGRRLVSIYLGGGTPSLWDPAAIGAVLDGAAARFGAALADLEVTIEANPADCTPSRMAAWRAAGIGRVSIGVQSLDAGELVVLGRDHRMGDGPAAVAAALGAGFRSVSADLILGAPTPGRHAGVPPSVTALAAGGAPHLSVYELTIEPRTRFGKLARDGALVPLDEDVLAELYVATHQALEAAGYEHYEVSSYARPGHRAVHNGLYWRGAEFLGLGVGAASFRLDAAGAGVREVNVRQTPRYLRGERIAETTTTPPAELAIDRLWLGLRTREGIAVDEVTAAGRGPIIERLIDEGLLERGDRIRPTLRGFLYNDRIGRLLVAG
jgi:oxygen-independent coproporphyrinogen-3 oxidase